MHARETMAGVIHVDSVLHGSSSPETVVKIAQIEMALNRLMGRSGDKALYYSLSSNYGNAQPNSFVIPISKRDSVTAQQMYDAWVQLAASVGIASSHVRVSPVRISLSQDLANAVTARLHDPEQKAMLEEAWQRALEPKARGRHS